MSEWSRRKLLGSVGAGGLGVIGGFYGLNLGQREKYPNCELQPPRPLVPPALGPDDAPVTVREFSDFSCPHCREYALDVFPRLRREEIDTSRVRYEHRDFPIPVNRWSRPAANAAREVQRRADASVFFEYAAALYRHQDEYSYKLFGSLAESVNVPAQPVEQAARNGRYCSVLNTERRNASKRGIEGTPTVVVNDRILKAPDLKEVTKAINR